jgi:hypothetical protein
MIYFPKVEFLALPNPAVRVLKILFERFWLALARTLGGSVLLLLTAWSAFLIAFSRALDLALKVEDS